jgi:hypothetical protein
MGDVNREKGGGGQLPKRVDGSLRRRAGGEGAALEQISE